MTNKDEGKKRTPNPSYPRPMVSTKFYDKPRDRGHERALEIIKNIFDKKRGI